MIQPNFIAAYIIDPNTNPEPLLLLLKRSPQDYLGGIWQIVTGRVEKGDSTLKTVKKEVFEETGLNVEKAHNVSVTHFYEKIKDEIGFSANFLVFADHNQKITLSPNEHDDYIWCSIKEAKDLIAFASQKETLNHINKYYLSQNPDNASLVTL
ncbi:MAG: NUDIX domain-containing protein [Chlamydiota bacterium]|jgi:8-oxo-dGTP diphosphatase